MDKIRKENRTIRQLRKIEIGLFTDILEDFGEFSGEMFQAMLGIQTEGNGYSAMYLKEKRSRFLGDPGFLLACWSCNKNGFNCLSE
jgi:hypothetical protein